jgi:PAS domain S-box-containing protein
LWKSNDFILLASPGMIPFFINAAGSRMIGIEREDVNKTRISDYFSSEDQKLFEEVVTPAMYKELRWTGEIHIRHVTTGELIPTIWNAFSIRDEKGEITAWATISPDLTELKKATIALRESELRFRDAIEGLFDAFVIMIPIYNSTGNLIDYSFEYANRVALELAGMTWEQYVGHRASELFPPETQKGVLAIYEAVLKTGKPAVIDAYPVRAPRGAYEQGIYLDIRASRLDGKIALAWRDVTSRIKADEIQRKSEQRFRDLANSMPQLVWTANPTALEWLIKHMKQNYGLTVDLSITGPIDQIKNETQLMLTQMVRELLNNVVQHAEVRYATVETIYRENTIHITVCDKGRGFNLQETINRKISGTHLGLFSIRERLKLFGGDLIIESLPGNGTCCTITLSGENYL